MRINSAVNQGLGWWRQLPWPFCGHRARFSAGALGDRRQCAEELVKLAADMLALGGSELCGGRSFGCCHRTGFSACLLCYPSWCMTSLQSCITRAESEPNAKAHLLIATILPGRFEVGTKTGKAAAAPVIPLSLRPTRNPPPGPIAVGPQACGVRRPPETVSNRSANQLVGRRDPGDPALLALPDPRPRSTPGKRPRLGGLNPNGTANKTGYG